MEEKNNACIRNTELGKSREEIQKKLEDTVHTFFYGSEEERIYHEVGADMGYLEDTGNHDDRIEGMSYGMMICVQLDMKEEFDRIWKWSKTYMWMADGENEGYFAWFCQTNGEKNAYGRLRTGKNILPWHFLRPTDGGMGTCMSFYLNCHEMRCKKKEICDLSP